MESPPPCQQAQSRQRAWPAYGLSEAASQEVSLSRGVSINMRLQMARVGGVRIRIRFQIRIPNSARFARQESGFGSVSASRSRVRLGLRAPAAGFGSDCLSRVRIGAGPVQILHPNPGLAQGLGKGQC